MKLRFGIAVLTFASLATTALAQEPPQVVHVSDNTAGGFAFVFTPGGLSGEVQVHQINDPITNSPSAFVDLFLYQSSPYFSIFLDGFAPGSAISSKAFDSVTLNINDLSTMDGGRFQFVSVIDCRSGTCVFSNDPSALPQFALNISWTRFGPRTHVQTGTQVDTFQDYLGGSTSTKTSGIRTTYDATFTGYLGARPPSSPNFAGIGSIFVSKGVTITFTRNPAP